MPHSPPRGLPAKEQLPTMHDLPSEDPEEPGLPDDFHWFQPQLMRETFRPPGFPPDRVYVATDLNLYFDPHHTQWHKRPDWFAVLDVPALTQVREMRKSYVVWQEEVVPFVVAELLSPGTESEDLGRTVAKAGEPPTKWEVYERVLHIPHYVVYDRYKNELRVFRLAGGRYRRVALSEDRVWFDELGLGLGRWSGAYRGYSGRWLRWYDDRDEWISTEAELRQQADRCADQADRRVARLAEKLRALGVDPDEAESRGN